MRVALPAPMARALSIKLSEQTFNEIFEREVAVFFVATGTAANSLAQASIARPGGVTFAHREAHIIEDEGGAPEFLTGGARLQAVDGAVGRMNIDNLEAADQRLQVRQCACRPADGRFRSPNRLKSARFTNSSEIAAISALCRKMACRFTWMAHVLPMRSCLSDAHQQT